MRRLTRSSFLVALTLTLGLATGCREPNTPRGKAPKDGGESAALEVQLPDPLPLPADPSAATWIAEPAAALSLVAPYSPVAIDLSSAARQALAPVAGDALAQEIAEGINYRAPFANVVLADGQEVIRLSLLSPSRASLAPRLAELEAVGEFGAVRLPARGSDEGGASPKREWLAWIDEGDGGALVLANSLEGLVTGRELERSYGEQPVFFTADPAALPVPMELPFSRVEGRGDLEHVVIEARPLEGQDPLAGAPLIPGTLGPLLAAPDLAIGASGRYAEHEAAVREITSQVNAQVRQLPFLVRNIGEDLAAKFNTLLRTWDGRALVAIGPPNHVRIAYGASDVNKSEIATIRLLQKVVDNLSLARNFMARLPKLSLRRRVAKSAGADIELLVLYEAHSTVPAELRSLVDDESRLNIAMAWTEHGGGGMIVIGPDAVEQLSAWLTASADAPAHESSASQLLAAHVAVEPAQLQELASASDQLRDDPRPLFGLAGTGPRWDVGVERGEGGVYRIDLRTPGPRKPARARP